MTKIKPIETIYNGYKFRSRLEARWAVGFDAVGIKYEYEPEGYLFDDGTRYLPDFKLLNVKHRSYTNESEPVYVEIKGAAQIPEDDMHKINLFSKEHPILVIKSIEDAEEQFDWWKGSASWSFEFIDSDMYPCMFTKCGDEIWLAGPDHDEWDGLELMQEITKAAKQARFEHGERSMNRNEHQLKGR